MTGDQLVEQVELLVPNLVEAPQQNDDDREAHEVPQVVQLVLGALVLQ